MSNIGITKVKLLSETNKEWEVVVDARLDTGASRTSIDESLADFLRLATVGEIKTRSANGRRVRELVELTFVYNKKEYTLDVSLSDRGKMQYPMLLGRDVLS